MTPNSPKQYKNFPILDFPVYEFNIRAKGIEDEIWDFTRKKFIKLTPEEWVRQHALHFLTKTLHYSSGMVKTEWGHKYNSVQKRTDILVYGKDFQPFILCECKAYNVPINRVVMEQAVVYNKTVGADYLYITNGKVHLCLFLNKELGRYEPANELPANG